MTRRRWIADEATSDKAWLVGDHARHLSGVLRVQPGQEFDIVAEGRIRIGRVTDVSQERVTFALGDEVPGPTTPNIALVLAIYKFDRMEWAIEKCIELGVASITPLVSARTDAHLAKAAAKRVERWRRLARQAAEQSRRSFAPGVAQAVQIEALAEVPAPCIVLNEIEQESLLHKVLDEQDVGSNQTLTLALGPEGGWTEAELGWFKTAGWISASLGTTILRAETAAIAATAVAFSVLAK